MRASELIVESMTMWIPDAPSEETKRPCSKCDGDKEYYNGSITKPCEMCLGEDGKPRGYWIDSESTAPEMKLSNSNAQAVMMALGYEADYGYGITPEEIPEVKRKIMVLLNKEGELDQHTEEPSDTQKDFGMVRSKDSETGLDKIERKQGARMIGGGRDTDYLKDKFQRILTILDYAQKHNMEISFA